MAADVSQAPRMARSTTNMEDAAAAARARRAPAGDHVDPDLTDNALADIEIARIFLDAADNYHDELTAWFNLRGCTPNRALLEEVNKAQIISREADDRLSLAEGRLRKALDQSYNAMPNQLRPAPDPRSFDAAWRAYVTAFSAGNAFYLLNTEADGIVGEAAQELFDAHVSAAFDCARILLSTPATCVGHIELKKMVIDQQNAVCWNHEHVEPFVHQLIADAIALAGGAK